MTRTFVPGRTIDDAFVAMLNFENGSVGTFEATRFGIGIKNGNSFQMHGSGGMLRFNLERLNHLEFVDATRPAAEQGLRDMLVTDMKHPIFPHFWRPGHIIGYEHTFIAALARVPRLRRPRRTIPSRFRRCRRGPARSWMRCSAPRRRGNGSLVDDLATRGFRLQSL